eukprot:gene40687-55019_t
MAHASEVPAPQPTLQDFKPATIRGTAGYFRVGQTHAGAWWFIDPEDGAFFSRGVNAVSRTGGRGATTGAYAAAVNALHGTGEPQVFVETVLVRLSAWRCNTLGAWTAPEFFDRGTAFAEVLEFRTAAAEATIRLAGANVPDVFDPRWVDACDRRAAERCAPRALSRDLIGYFTDHEPVWAQPAAEAAEGGDGGQRGGGEGRRAERPSLLQICLSLEPSFPAYHAAWEFALAAHGGELATLARAWGATLPTQPSPEPRLMHPTGYTATWSELNAWLRAYGDLPGAERIYALALKRKPTAAATPKPPAFMEVSRVWGRVESAAVAHGNTGRAQPDHSRNGFP